jgi:hypothetical protein
VEFTYRAPGAFPPIPPSRLRHRNVLVKAACVWFGIRTNSPSTLPRPVKGLWGVVEASINLVCGRVRFESGRAPNLGGFFATKARYFCWGTPLSSP